MTIELIALMIVAGLVAGCVGHYVMTDGYGPAADASLGVAGSVVTGTLFRAFGFGLEAGCAILAQRSLAPAGRTSRGQP